MKKSVIATIAIIGLMVLAIGLVVGTAGVGAGVGAGALAILAI